MDSEGNQGILILVHGYHRHASDLQTLADAFVSHFQILVPDLPTTRGNLEASRKKLREYLELHGVLQTSRPVHFVCHSLGGLVVRDFLVYYEIPSLQSLIFLGTPHLGSLLARWACWFGMQICHRALLDLLPPGLSIPSPRQGWPDRVALVAGIHNSLWLGRLAYTEQADGRVSLESAWAKSSVKKGHVLAPFPSYTARLQINLNHHEMMHHERMVHMLKDLLGVC